MVTVLARFTDGLFALLQFQDGAPPETIEGGALLRLSTLLLYVGAAFYAFRREPVGVQTVGVWSAARAVWILVLLAAVSVFWSAEPQVTVVRSVGLFATTLFGVYFARRYPLAEQIRLLGLACSLVLVLSYLFALLLPSFGVMSGEFEGAWRGVFTHKNGLGRFATLSVLVFAFRLRDPSAQRGWAMLALLLSLLLVPLSTSKTSLIVLCALALLVPISASMRSRSRWMPIYLGVAALLLGGTGIWAMFNADKVVLALGRDLTLSGRLALWYVSLSFVAAKPWLGYGQGAFWSGDSQNTVSQLIHAAAPHAHNGLIDLTLDLGLVGLCIFLLGYIAAVSRAVRALRGSQAFDKSWPFFMLAFLLLTNLSESAILRHNNIFWVLFVASAVTAAGLNARTAIIAR